MSEQVNSNPESVSRRITVKLTSGRWLFTVAAAITFVAMAVTDKLEPQSVKEVILLVTAFYFGQHTLQKDKAI